MSVFLNYHISAPFQDGTRALTIGYFFSAPIPAEPLIIEEFAVFPASGYLRCPNDATEG
jgi:hypothetical protein